MAWSIGPSNSTTVGGVNLNRVIPYRTAKFVEIRDWRLGALQRTMTVIIFMKIIVVDIVYYNQHLKPFPVHGVVHTQLHQPTEDLWSRASMSRGRGITRQAYALLFANLFDAPMFDRCLKHLPSGPSRRLKGPLLEHAPRLQDPAEADEPAALLSAGQGRQRASA